MQRGQVSIPVKKDPHTFEESRSAFLDRMENRMTNLRSAPNAKTFSTEDSSHSSSVTNLPGGGIERSEITSSKTVTTSSSSSSTTNANSDNRDFADDKRLLDSGFNDWILESRSKFDSDCKRLRENFFNLESDGGDMLGWPSKMPELGQLSMGLGGDNFSSTLQSSSTKTSSSTSTFSSSSTTTSSSSNTTKGDDKGMLMNRMPSLFDKKSQDIFSKTGSNLFEKGSKDLYEMGEDGKMHFKVRFEAKDYSPDDIQVTSIGNRLSVKAKCVKKTETSSSTREFSKTVDLPDRIDHEHFSCTLTKDGVLEIDAPVKTPEYQSISYLNGELGIRPRQLASTEHRDIVIANKSGTLSIVNDKAGRKIAHIEVPIEPPFVADDIHVSTSGKNLTVKARHENKSNGSSSFQEFSKSYDLPESPDPLSVSAVFSNNVLVIEAPLKYS